MNADDPLGRDQEPEQEYSIYPLNALHITSPDITCGVLLITRQAHASWAEPEAGQ